MKLKVGDIEMDSQGEVIAGTTTLRSSTYAESTHAVATTAPIHQTLPEASAVDFDLTRVPLALRIAIFSHLGIWMMVTASSALAALIFNAAWLGLAAFGALQAPLAAGTLYAISRHYKIKSLETSSARELAEGAQRVLELLRSDQRALPAGEISSALGIGNDEAVQALAGLLEQGRIEEDIDIETGRFIYRAQEDFYLDPENRSVTERFTETQRQHAISQRENA